MSAAPTTETKKPFAHHNLHFRPKASPPTGGYYADQVCKAYGFPTNVAVGGKPIGIIELGGSDYASDLQTFCKARGLPVPTINRVLVNGATIQPDPGNADVEVMLDVENVTAAFPGQPINIYYCDNTETGFVAGVQQALDACSAVSCSWGAPEDQWSANGLSTMSAAISGSKTPFFAASGDSGSSDGEKGLHVDFPASAVGSVACGGTSLPSLTSLASETAWSDSGGGISAKFSKPSYQSGETLSGPMRGSPDVAACADPNTPYNVFVNGGWLQVGGTSAVAPLMAGLFAALGTKVSLPSDVHPALYAKGTCRDITSGSNGKYSASVGYDLVTGNGVAIPSAVLVALGLNAPPSPPSPPPVSPPSPPPSPPPVSPPSPPSPPPSQPPVSVATIMQLIDAAFAQAIQDANGNQFEVLALQEVQKFIDQYLPPILATLQAATKQIVLTKIQSHLRSSEWLKLAAPSVLPKLTHRLGVSALPADTLLTLLQDLLAIIQQIIQELQGGGTNPTGGGTTPTTGGGTTPTTGTSGTSSTTGTGSGTSSSTTGTTGVGAAGCGAGLFANASSIHITINK